MNKLFPAALTTAALALAGCGSGSDNEAQSASKTTQAVLSLNETCDQLFDTIGARTSFGRLARALHATPDSLPLLTESDQTVLELAPTAEGLDVMAPAEA